MKKYKFEVLNIVEKIMILFFVLVCLMFLLLFIRGVYKKTGTKRHKITLLENIDRLRVNKLYSDTINGIYHFRFDSIDIPTDNRDTTVNLNLKDSYYHCVFWDYRGEYYENSTFIQRFFWDDFIVNGSYYGGNAIDSIIIMKLKLKIIKEYNQKK